MTGIAERHAQAPGITSDRLDGDVLGADPAGSYALSTDESQDRSTPGTGSLTCSSMAGTWPPRPGAAGTCRNLAIGNDFHYQIVTAS